MVIYQAGCVSDDDDMPFLCQDHSFLEPVAWSRETSSDALEPKPFVVARGHLHTLPSTVRLSLCEEEIG
jgi:hypothetical protein